MKFFTILTVPCEYLGCAASQKVLVSKGVSRRGMMEAVVAPGSFLAAGGGCCGHTSLETQEVLSEREMGEWSVVVGQWPWRAVQWAARWKKIFQGMKKGSEK